jgi:hypothetical protein
VASVADVLSWVPLTEAVEVIRGGIPRPLIDPFYNLREEISGNVASYINWQGTRQLARMTPYGSRPAPTNKLSLSSTNVVLLNYLEEMPFQEDLIKILRQWEEYKPQQMFALRNMTWQGEEFSRRFDNAEAAAIHGFIAYGAIYFDNQGNMLPSASGAFQIVSQYIGNSVPSTNTGTLGGLLTGSFADPDYDIVTFLTQKLRPRALEDTNYRTETAIYGANIPGYFAINQYTTKQWGFQKEFALPYLYKGQVPERFCDFNWINASEMYFQDNTATNQLQFPPDQITFMPKIDKKVWTVYVGSTLVPTSFGPLLDGPAMLKGGYAEKFGRYRFAWIPQGTTSIMDTAGHVFIPRMKIPLSTYFLNSTA